MRLPPRGRTILRHSLYAIFVGVLVCYAVMAGYRIRHWTYEHTDSLRHDYDISHNLLFGTRAMDEGVLNLYRNIQSERRPSDYKLDYVPLRLLTMRLWAGWVRDHHGDLVHWKAGQDLAPFWRAMPFEPTWDVVWPLLYFNMSMELMSALAIFLLIRLWLRRHAAAERAPPDHPLHGVPVDPWHGVFAGLAGAGLMWFSPASQISAIGWPSWDIWVVPFYLWTILLACWGGWFWSGLLLGIGTMFKGQQLMVMPLMLMWPLFMGQWRQALHWFSGYAIAVTLIVSPWLIRFADVPKVDPRAMAYLMLATVGLLCIVIAMRWRPRGRIQWILLMPGFVLLLWPMLNQWQGLLGLLGLLLIPLTLGVATLRRRMNVVACLAGAAATVLILCPIFYSGDFSWFDVSFRYGSEKFPQLGQWCANTLGALLDDRFGWNQLSDTAYEFTFAGQSSLAQWLAPLGEIKGDGLHVIITIKMTLIAIYSVCLVLCALGLALQSRRQDKHFLAAAAAPWICAFAFMPQMHARYLLFGASAAALAAGLNVGLVLLDLFLIFLAWLMTMNLMLGGNRDAGLKLEPYVGPEWQGILRRWMEQLHPDIAWAVILTALIFLYVGLTRSRSRWPVRTSNAAPQAIE